MQRYDENLRYVPARGVPGRGGDPNYRGGMYRGLRMQPDEPGRAPYGRDRLRHAGDLGGYGYFPGIYRRTAGARGPRYDLALLNRYDQSVREAHPAFRSRRDPELLREFNANSPALRFGTRGGDVRGPAAADPRAEPPRLRGGYTNRGVTPSGFGERWPRR